MGMGIVGGNDGVRSAFTEAMADKFLSASERNLVRAEGIEPSSHAWEARIIPVYYARKEQPD
jgi:hypothetical protein